MKTSIVIENDGDTALIESAEWQDVIRVTREPDQMGREAFLAEFPVGMPCRYDIERHETPYQVMGHA